MTAPNPVPAPPGGSAIALTTKFFPLAFFFLLIKPLVTLNGYQLPRESWGRRVIPVQPGTYQVHVHVPYFLPARIGPADLTVPVAPGQTVELEYRAPAFTYSPGSLGAPPQRYNGLWVQWVLLGVVALILLCCCGSVVLRATSG